MFAPAVKCKLTMSLAWHSVVHILKLYLILTIRWVIAAVLPAANASKLVLPVHCFRKLLLETKKQGEFKPTKLSTLFALIAVLVAS